jgi:MGT family glycosyltransferase
MAHFGMLAYKGTGHLNPLISLSHELVGRGHRVTFFLAPDKSEEIRKNGFGFVAVCNPASPWPSNRNAQGSVLEQLRAIYDRLKHIDFELRHYLDTYLNELRSNPVDLLIMGEITLTGPIVAEFMSVPYVVISTSIPHNFGWIPPRHLRPTESCIESLQRRLLEVSIFNMHGPIKAKIQKHRHRLGLKHPKTVETSNELAHITQWPSCLDIHRSTLPPRVHYTGPFANPDTRSRVTFPWNRLDGRPLVYVSLGTTKRGEEKLFRNIAAACHELNLQAVITLGGRGDLAPLTDLPGEPIVVSSAPQLQLLQKADLVITHAGPNTVLETLQQGKPMLALALALDQPAIAGHLERLHCAVALPSQERSVADIRRGLERLRHDETYRKAAEKIKAQLGKTSGVSVAANLIELEWKKYRQKTCRKVTATLQRNDKHIAHKS